MISAIAIAISTPPPSNNHVILLLNPTNIDCDGLFLANASACNCFLRLKDTACRSCCRSSPRLHVAIAKLLAIAIGIAWCTQSNTGHVLKLGGGDGPDHLRVVSPGQRPRDRSKMCLSDFFASLRVRLRSLSCLLSLYYVS